MAAGRTVSTLRTMVLFALLGPLSAAAVILLIWGFGIWRFGLPNPHEPGDYWAVTVLVVFFGYYIGGLPALLTGLGAGLASPRLKQTWLWVLACTVLGVVLTVVIVSLFARGEPRGVSAMAGWYLFVGSAVVGSVVSALATVRLRPGPAAPAEPVETEYLPEQP